MEIIHIFNPESIANAYADAADEAQELHMMFNRLLDKIRLYENYADIEGRPLTYDEICACIEDDFDKSYVAMFIRFHSLYHSTMGAFDTLYCGHESNLLLNDVVENSQDIGAKTEDGVLYVQLPHVPAKTFRRFSIFAEELMAMMYSLLEENQMPRFGEKLMRMINVFPSTTPVARIPDNDNYNYDYKQFIDIITDFCSAGDGGLSTSLLYEAFPER